MLYFSATTGNTLPSALCGEGPLEQCRAYSNRESFLATDEDQPMLLEIQSMLPRLAKGSDYREVPSPHPQLQNAVSRASQQKKGLQAQLLTLSITGNCTESYLEAGEVTGGNPDHYHPCHKSNSINCESLLILTWTPFLRAAWVQGW